MSRLWDKGTGIDPAVLSYTVGEDYLLDLTLVPFDALASMAHAAMLRRIGVLSQRDLDRIAKGLSRLMELWEKGEFEIAPEQEDCHTAIENFLVRRCGKAGAKVHAGRSRNDQAATALRLYTKYRLLNLRVLTAGLASDLVRAASRYTKAPMPGYTHTRPAMPTTVATYFASYAEALLEDLEMVEAACALNDSSPLGAAAGYGASLKLDRAYTARLLGFASVQANPINAVSSRARMGWWALLGAASVMGTLARMASDLILFSAPEFGYFELDESITTGSSIMPHKKNPDVLELLRANAGAVAQAAERVRASRQSLPSGYHRDVQTAKEPLIVGLERTMESVKVTGAVLRGLKVNARRCAEAVDRDVLAADRALAMAAKGVPFREAYRKVARTGVEQRPKDLAADLLTRKHLGAPGNLGLQDLRDRARAARKAADGQRRRFVSRMSRLMEGRAWKS